MRRVVTNLLGVVLVLASIHVEAALISLPSPFGPESITRDAETGLDWLDLTVTTGLSNDDVALQMLPGGRFFGFRYATKAELDFLMKDAGIPKRDGSYMYYEDAERTRMFMELVGVTGIDTTAGMLGVRAWDWQSSDVRDVGFAFYGCWGAPGVPPICPYGRVSAGGIATSMWKGERSSSVGSFLVRPVPEPETYAMMLAGLGILGGICCRRKRKGCPHIE